jgi:acyl-CoA synthetase (AMP-forming)/AMP-acid ligase II
MTRIIGGGVEVSFSPEMIERVLTEWEEEHPGRNATRDMGADEFTRRMMAEIRASARRIAE